MIRRSVVVTILAAGALAGLTCLTMGACKNGSRGCKVEDQCGRMLDKGVDKTCTEIKCVPRACGKEHYTMMGGQMCKDTPPLPPGEHPSSSAAPAPPPTTSAK